MSAAGLFAKATTDGNAAALDKALEALQAFLEKAPEPMAARFAGTVSSNIVKKTCGARASTAAKGIDCLMGLVELEQAEKVLVSSAAAEVQQGACYLPRVAARFTLCMCQGCMAGGWVREAQA